MLRVCVKGTKVVQVQVPRLQRLDSRETPGIAGLSMSRSRIPMRSIV
jgi:hypothetical protein